MTTFERDLLTGTLADADGNKSAAARALGMSRVTLLDRLKRYDRVIFLKAIIPSRPAGHTLCDGVNSRSICSYRAH